MPFGLYEGHGLNACYYLPFKHNSKRRTQNRPIWLRVWCRKMPGIAFSCRDTHFTPVFPSRLNSGQTGQAWPAALFDHRHKGPVSLIDSN